MTFDVTVVIPPQTFEVLGCVNTSNQTFFLNPINVFCPNSYGLLFIIVFYSGCSECNIR